MSTTDSLGGQHGHGTHAQLAAEGQTSPQAIDVPVPEVLAPARSETSRSQSSAETHKISAAADDFPGGHPVCGTQA